MTKYERLKKKCQQQGVKFEETPTMIGIATDKGLWHWFNHYHGTLLTFDHTYSQNTGKTKSGLQHRLKVYDWINRKFKLDI